MTTAENIPSRRKATVWSLVFDYGALALSIVRNLALVPLYLHFIDLELYGAWLATGATLAVMFVSDFGLLGVVVQRTGSAYGARDFQRLGRIIGTSFFITAGLAAAISILTTSMAPYISSLMGLHGADAEVMRSCFLIVIAASIFNLFGLFAQEVLKSLQKPFGPGIFKLLSELLGIGATVVLILQGAGLYSLAGGIAVRGLTTSVGNLTVGLLYCRRRLNLQLRLSWSTLQSMWEDSFYQFFTSIGLRIQTHSNQFLVGVMLGGKEAAIYGITAQAFITIRLFLGQIGFALRPSLAHLHGSGNPDRFKAIFIRMLQAYAIVGVMGMAGFLAFNRPFISLWLGLDKYGGDLLTILLAGLGLIGALTGALFATMSSRGEFPRICRTIWTATLVQIPLAFWLLHFGLWGVAAASLIGMMLTYVLLTTYLWPLLGYSGSEHRTVSYSLMRLITPSLIVAITVFWVRIPASSWSIFILQTGAFITLILIITVLCNRVVFLHLVPEFRDTLRAIRNS